MQNINIGTEINIQDLLNSRLLIQANSGGGKSVLARVIIEETFGRVPFIVMDIEGEYYTLKEKYGDVLIIGGQHADIPISMKSVKLLPKEIIGNRLSVVIDMSDLVMNDRILYAKYFLETMMDLPNKYWINYLVFIEEAHKLCGQQDMQASATAVKDLMSRGRKRGYCGVLVTQRISKLHKDAAAECNNKFIGRTFLDIDLDRAAKELGLSSAADKNVIRNLMPGTFYAFGTSIEPHHVHIVKINLPKTKIPKAGVNLDIKPQAPTAAIKSMLVKLNELPAAAEKEARTMLDQQKEISRLTLELSKAKKTQAPSPVNVKLQNDLSNENRILKEERDHAYYLMSNANHELTLLKKYFGKSRKALGELDELASLMISETSGRPTITHKPEPARRRRPEIHLTGQSNSAGNIGSLKTEVSKSTGNGQLGKCSKEIIKFLAQYPDRQFSKAQVAIATGYSSGSGGFNNALSELNTLQFIIRSGKLQVNSDAMDNIIDIVGPIEHREYNIKTYINNLGKCEAEIYQVLLDNPQQEYNKENLADATATQYSSGSGGFNNAISRLNTLELIERRSGMIKLNPELLELM